jgi:GMP synthase (glutamine-hydrolysing)
MILLISVNQDSLHNLEFVKPIENILTENKINFFTKHYSKLSKTDFKKADKIIICGTSLKDLDYINHLTKFNWIRDFEKPILGICAGMQIIAKIFAEGKNILDRTEIGMTPIKFEKEFLGISEGNFECYELHQVGIIKVGKNFDVYAKSNKGIQAIKHKRKQIYGVLFHPEVRNKNLIINFCKI